ncbi:RNA polymerase sigma factor [Candidatus Microgenomates bacterium]|jgi:RNA polymerase sigma-70 factor (ECF subfamily)|nr:MAG: RNA polymerase sigma factor [Candidatus Microgenomates bacterium]
MTDEELVERVLNSDKEALGELFRRYHKPFFNLSYRFLGDHFLAEDLTSEIFLRIYKYLKTFDKGSRFKPWAYKVATNTCLSFRKAKTTFLFPKIKNENGEWQEKEVVDEKTNLLDEVCGNEIAERVQKALQKLPEKYRLALFLYYFEDLKYNEIAESLGMPVNTIRTHIKRGKEKLESELSDLI